MAAAGVGAGQVSGYVTVGLHRVLPVLLLAALKAAKPGQVVFLRHGVEINLTDLSAITIPGGVTLAGTRGLKGSPGARVFTTWRKTHRLMCTAGENVRLTGLRFEGASGSTARTAEQSSFLGIGHAGCEVDNCEVYSFNVNGISVGQTAIHVRIHHNHIHHCQRSGYGYGVVTGSIDIHIIANRFDYCRHMIASGSGKQRMKTGMRVSTFRQRLDPASPNTLGLLRRCPLLSPPHSLPF